MKKRKICVVTGTRAEYGLLHWLMKFIDEEPTLQLQIIATGTHLSSEFGLTYREIEKDCFRIDKKIEMLLSADTSSAISKSTGLGLIGFADALDDLRPDLVVVLGDRFEILAVSIAATIAKITIVHISGGETTLGAYDEAFRHSITKMAWLHFCSNEKYKKRLIQLGEDPERIFNVGGLGVDAIKRTKFLSQKELMKVTGIKFGKRNLIVTYHPVTLEKSSSSKHFKNLLDVLDDLKDVYIIFTMPNADSDSSVIKKMINEFVSFNKKSSIAFASMGHLHYLSTLQFVDGVIGNSSSGLTEAPSFKIGTINIGDRQKGRLKSKSVIDCNPEKKSICSAIKTLYSKKFQKNLSSIVNPNGNGEASEKILEKLLSVSIPKEPKKKFYDL